MVADSGCSWDLEMPLMKGLVSLGSNQAAGKVWDRLTAP